MKDSLGLFGHTDDPDGRGSGGTDHTGEYDMAELRAALRTSRTDQATLPREPTRERRALRLADENRRRRRRRSSLVAVIVLLLIAGGTFFLVRTWSTEEVVPPADFVGAGTTETVVRVNANDGSRQIGTALFDAKVVASVEAFVADADGDDGMRGIQPGYYKVRQGASASAAVAALLDDQNRVGRIDLIPGVTLADTRTPTGETASPGYVTQITQAACVPLNGVADCFTTDELWQQIRTADVASMGLVDWAVQRVAANPDLDHRLEGMIAPGVYNIPPTDDPAVVLRYLLGASAVYWNTSGISTQAAGANGDDPYELAVIASLIEREAITGDMGKVSRVIQNRLGVPMRLQLDSTVNYARNESQIATTEADRLDAGSPYNTYAHEGLPPTPIGGIGPDALAAALRPADGDWLYFVKVNPKTGQSCFSATLEAHNACVEQARAAGVFG
ncbi:endolytic transglycosylase MltG [Nakamurella deserti]|uniref:endolytic transglycosylase MltG n=1 Tax=Nakamurella deserti TaxID=2164074 RepID=UPI000DBE64CF|nr:endolytic transglycosylase MltG [Nakamurella deserti]